MTNEEVVRRYAAAEIEVDSDALELRDGKVYRETLYWAEPFEAPEWRKQFTDATAA